VSGCDEGGRRVRAGSICLWKRLLFGVVAKCLRGVRAKRRYRGGVSKFLGFLLGVAVALAGPAVFGVLAAPGGIELNAKEMALAFGIGALIFWTVVSYFSGAGALGAFVAFGTLIYCWLWIPNRTTNFLNDVPGVTTGMIDGSKQYTLNGVVPVLAVISLVYSIQLIVLSVQRRRRQRAEAARLQREQEAAQAQQEADEAAVYPVAGSTYPVAAGQYGGSFGNNHRYDDLFDEDPTPVPPRSQADEQTAHYPTAEPEQTAVFPDPDASDNDADGNDSGDDTVLVPSDRDETVQVPTTEPEPDEQPTAPAPVAIDEPKTSGQPETDDQPTATAPAAADEQSKPEEPAATQQEKKDAEGQQQAVTAPVTEAKEQAAAEVPDAKEQAAPVAEAKEQAAPVADVEEQTVLAPQAKEAAAPAVQVREAGPAAKVREQVGQQYRERMDDPEDTGEFHFNAFETQVINTARPAGA